MALGIDVTIGCLIDIQGDYKLCERLHKFIGNKVATT
jgi:hypothetical protein